MANTTCKTPTQYELPTHDASCGIPNTEIYKSLFEPCAQPVAVRSYNDDCALWAPAVDQSTQNLIDCLYKAGVKWEDVWCTGGANETASGSYPTATATAAASASASKTTSSDGARETGDDDEEDKDGENGGAVVRGRAPGLVAWGVLGLVFMGLFGV
ncbi:hypothetical protein BDW59DRAFT_156844 [Aspergillus cavernicola]|uniref:Extracellular membrane protein CFEM domain-containing protein n=1 Tax=Aspergillus cavernicola TaxID=176166 RepID=A0ABR4IZX1_9EURO